MRLLLVAALLVAAGCSAAAQPMPGHGAAHVHRPATPPPVVDGAAGRAVNKAAVGTRFQRDMDAGMARMMQDMHAAPPSGNVDADFLAMMIPHHAGAVDMARLVLQHGQDPATRQMAEDIIAGQTTEIESMTRRLQMLRAGRLSPAEAEFPALGGTRGP